MTNAYKKYRSVNIGWLNNIPEQWNVLQIKHLKIGSNTLFIDGDWIESNVITDYGIRYLTTGNIGAGVYKEQGAGFISEETFNELNCTEVFPGDLVISRLNEPIGRACIIPDLGFKIVTAVDNVILRPKEGFDRKYLMYLMNSTEYSSYTSMLARGATMQRISRGQLGNIRIPAPSFSEQTQIARFLDHQTGIIDQLIQQKQKLIELLKEKRQAVINEAVTKGLNQNAKMKDSGIEWLGEIPKHWLLTKMKFGCEFILDGTHGSFARVDNGYRLLSVRNIVDGKFIYREDDSCISEKDYLEISSKFKIIENDIQLAIVGATLGKVAIVEKMDIPFVTQRSLATIRTNLSKCLPKYLFYFLTSSYFQSYLWLSTSFSAQPGVYLGTIQKCELPLPSIPEQEEIISLLDNRIADFNNLIEINQSCIEKLKEYRQSLISEAVTGKIDVRDWEPNKQEVA